MIVDLLITVKSTPEKTYYKALQKLSPGHFLFHKNDDLIIKNYYIPTIKSTPKIHTFEEATELMREKLRNAVKRRINNSSNVACELSGGIDSTAVCAISIEYNSAITGLSHAMNDATKLFFPYTDEKELINDFLDYSHLKKHHFVAPVEEGILDVIQESISWMAYPQQFSYQWFSDILYKKAQLEGASTLLSGFGGDEGVSMHRSAMSEMLLQNMNYIDFIQFEKIRSQTSSSKATIRLIKQLLKQFLEQQFLYKKFQKQNFSLNNLSINLNELNQTEISNRYDQYKYGKKGYPDYTQYYCRVFQNHVSTRIDACSVMAGHYGIEYRYPLLDIDLLEFFFSLPICFKVSPTQTRYLYREAIKGYIPDSIRLRNDKSGATIPTVRYRLNKDFKLIESILQNVSGEKAYYVDGNKSIQSMNEILSGASKVTHPSAFYSTLNYLLQP